ncbi:NAD(P)/FAD-dependent oxidoreductase [Tritonibacter multivorans]|nr:FAD-binding oxidoreductase [Tritonibacter multivorans]MDA7420640.1 FAD-binding oxidoreductase [Tritonibacter multivorans]
MALNLLHANDAPGQYPTSWYAATATPLDPFPALVGDAKADVCIIGAGFTGLSAALHLAERGYSVTLLEAQRVGFGASGRNGGQLGSGQRQDQEKLEAMMGRDDAAKLWDLGEEAKDLVRDLVTRHKIDCHLKPGVAWTGMSHRETRDLHAYADFLNDRYGYDQIEKLGQSACEKLCPSPAYHGGILDMGAGHLHPLNFALGLARAAHAAGAKIHEQSEVLSIAEDRQVTVKTAQGSLRADHLILACNGYLGRLNPKVAARVMPINNFIAATEPLGLRTAEVLNRDVAVADSKFVVNYFRLSHDGRLLFGGGESYGYRFPTDIAAKVRAPLLEIFPHLADVKIDYAWGGTLAITMKRLPHFARLSPRTLAASGYSGHGLGTATHAGRLLAEAVAGQSEGFDLMARLPVPPFPGGAHLRSPLLTLAMTWYALRDRLGV